MRKDLIYETALSPRLADLLSTKDILLAADAVTAVDRSRGHSRHERITRARVPD